jgi:RNase P subunit RPR2
MSRNGKPRTREFWELPGALCKKCQEPTKPILATSNRLVTRSDTVLEYCEDCAVWWKMERHKALASWPFESPYATRKSFQDLGYITADSPPVLTDKDRCG